MSQAEQDKFSVLFTNLLMTSGIEYAYGKAGDSYVLYDDKGILCSVAYYRTSKKYYFSGTEAFKSEYKKYGLPENAAPNPKMVFESVAFAYKIRQTVLRAKKDFDVLYKDVLSGSDIVYHMRGDFETYMVTNNGFPGYAIGYNKKTGKYGFKRYLLINTLYTLCDIPDTQKPDYASLYKRTQVIYNAQVAIYNIEHLYD